MLPRSLRAPPLGRQVVCVELDRLQQPFAEPSANRGPALTLAVIGDQAVAFGGVIPRALKGMRVERVCSIVRDRASAGAPPRRRRRAE
jgi:hypothetical protein